MWNWPNHPKFVTIGAVTRIDNKIFTGNEGGRSWRKRDGCVSFCGGRQ